MRLAALFLALSLGFPAFAQEAPIQATIQNQIDAFQADDFAKAYTKCDVILTPTSPTVAFKFGDKTSNPLAMYLCDVFTIPTNLAGHAAMSVPFGTGEAGLPVGVQILAPALGEAPMFRVAAELERAQ